MDPLHTRRQAQRLTLMYKITNNYIDIDPHTYLHSTNSQRTRNTHNHTYQTYATTDSYKHSFSTHHKGMEQASTVHFKQQHNRLLHKTNTYELVTTTPQH